VQFAGEDCEKSRAGAFRNKACAVNEYGLVATFLFGIVSRQDVRQQVEGLYIASFPPEVRGGGDCDSVFFLRGVVMKFSNG